MLESYVGKDWIETYTGRQVRPMRPDWRAFNLFDIAHALSMTCRYGGHVHSFYSVAEHSCAMALWIFGRGGSPAEVLEAMVHDAAEAYFPDMPRPVKQFFPEFVLAEKRVGQMIRSWVGLPGIDPPKIIKELDSRILRDERRQFMGKSPHVWSTDSLEPLGVELEGLAPPEAEMKFLKVLSVALNRHLGRPVLWLGESDVTIGHLDRELRFADVVMVDTLGGVALMRSRGEDGMMERDRSRKMPTPATMWVHGKFSILEAPSQKPVHLE